MHIQAGLTRPCFAILLLLANLWQETVTVVAKLGIGKEHCEVPLVEGPANFVATYWPQSQSSSDSWHPNQMPRGFAVRYSVSNCAKARDESWHHIEVPESTMLCESWISTIMVTWIVLGKAVTNGLHRTL